MICVVVIFRELIEQDKQYIKRIEKELQSVCTFPDWNPDHFLDTAEMAMAVSIALDWTGQGLNPEIRQLALSALSEKALLTSMKNEKYNWWIDTDNNWGQVCHGGMCAAALVIADTDPELAAQVISRALENLHLPLQQYAPDGAYPEGPGYWGYGTGYQILTIEMCESALGSNFGMTGAPGFLESALYRLMVHSPGVGDFNYSDNNRSKILSLATRELLLWFAQNSKDALFYDKTVLKQISNYEIPLLPNVGPH